ncbi:MAG TPA: glycosyltransferase family 2 protein, partial [Candidatus Dormibacteraeota bacterium]|nr:glycosyltransferase family 2 protein [Candidatus Dormibacteraeota bacterium]
MPVAVMPRRAPRPWERPTLLVQLLLFFALSTAASTLFLTLAPRAPLPISAGFAVAADGAAAWTTSWLTDDPAAWLPLLVLGLGVAVVAPAVLRRWSVVAAQLLGSLVAGSVLYLAYAAVQTLAPGIAVSTVVLSLLLLLAEILALFLTCSYAFELLDVVATPPSPQHAADPTWLPWVAIQVPTYNEPVEVVGETLYRLAHLDYPRLIVQVVDNNTPDPAVWRPIEEYCAQLGPRFRFMHLDDWPGYKAGACNEATRRLPAEVEVIGVVDADYTVDPRWLRDTVGHFADPRVAFVQTPQHYRDWEDDPYLRGLFYSYRYFFEVSMPARAHRNAIIFCGTMGLIRRSDLAAIGGWSETCITEDAEASLRILAMGDRLGVYVPQAYGSGLMPLTFDGLRKQRHRWALGGVQILRDHAGLLAGGRDRSRLTTAQRLHYLLGGIQWFGEPLTAAFTVLLLVTAAITGLHHSVPLRQVAALVLAVPLLSLVTGVGRAVWGLRTLCRCSWGDASRALRVWFALSWVVTGAVVAGLTTRRAEFLRTPKRREGEARLWHALRAARVETAVTVASVAGAVALVVRAPGWTTATLSCLLLAEAFVFSSAIWASLAAEGIVLTPARRAALRSSQQTGERPVLRTMAYAL